MSNSGIEPIHLRGQEIYIFPSVFQLPVFELTVTVEKVKAVAVAHYFPCSSPPTVYGLGEFQHCGLRLR